MVKIEKDNCIDLLKKDGPPIIIVTAVQEGEAIINACKSNGIKVDGVCDSFKDRVNRRFCASCNYTMVIWHIPFSKEGISSFFAKFWYACWFTKFKPITRNVW